MLKKLMINKDNLIQIRKMSMTNKMQETQIQMIKKNK